MEKTLDSAFLIYRSIVAIALAVFIAGLSIREPESPYEEARAEIQSLEDGIKEASEQVEQGYSAIDDASGIKAAAVNWLRMRAGISEPPAIRHVDPDDMMVPDESENPSVTLSSQVRWADRIYREPDYHFFLCAADQTRFTDALDTLFPASPKPRVTKLTMRVYKADEHSPRTLLRCEVEVEYNGRKGKVGGIGRAVLNLPTKVLSVSSIYPPGPKWVDLELAHSLKRHGLGDFEEARALVIPAVRQMWANLGDRTPSAALVFLKLGRAEEAKKGGPKIKILGQSFNGSVTIEIAVLAEFCLAVYFLAQLMQIQAMADGHLAAVWDSPLFGIARSRFGHLVMLFTLMAPAVVCSPMLGWVLPRLVGDWTGPPWIVGRFWRSTQAVGISALDLTLVYYFGTIARSAARSAEGATARGGTAASSTEH